MSDFGGKIRFRAGATPLVLRGKVDIEPVDEERDIVDNQNGSFDVTRKPKKERADLTFVDSDEEGVTSSATGIDWNTIIKGGPYDFTIIEDDIGVMHTFSAGKFTGRPKIDRTSGEVTGLTVVGTYKRTTT